MPLNEPSAAVFRQLVPTASDELIDWLTLAFDTLTSEQGYRAIPHDFVRDLLPILAGLGFNWPLKEQMDIMPRLKR